MGDQNLRGGEKGLHGMHKLTEFSQIKKSNNIRIRKEVIILIKI